MSLEQLDPPIVAERDILIMDIESIAGKPDIGGDVTRRLADAGVNINLIYTIENNRIVLGVDDPDKALSALCNIEVVNVICLSNNN